MSLQQQIVQVFDSNRDVLIQGVEMQGDTTASIPGRASAREISENLHIGAKMVLDNLSQAIAVDSPVLFADYVAWSRETMMSRHISIDRLALNLERVDQVLAQILPVEFRPLVKHYISAGLAQLPQTPDTLPTFLRQDEPLSDLAGEYLELLLRGQRHQASQLILQAVTDNVPVKELYLHVFQSTQQEIGRLWQLNQLTVAQEHYCTAATQMIMSQLYPYIFTGRNNRRTLVATCVSTEMHEIGLRMVADFFEMDGWDTYYIGANAPIDTIVETLIERDADLLAVSATMTIHVRAVTRIIDAVRAEHRCGHVSIIVGGYPFHIEPNLWRAVGADGCADNAQAALQVANSIVRN